MSTNKINNLILLLSASFLFSCGSSNDVNDNISELRFKKDSLKEVKNQVASQLSELEKKIQVLDTGSNRNMALVNTETIVESSFKHFFEVQGVVETDQNATINAEVGANVISIEVSEGSNVKKGQILLKLDGRVIENSLNETKTQLELAETIYQKQKGLWDQKIGSEVAYLEAKNNVDNLTNRMATINSQLEMYYIKAPFDGIVDEIFPKIGEIASPMSPMIRLINLDKVYIKADVSERYLNKIAVGDTAIIEIPSLNYSIKSSINRIGSFINPNNRSFKVRFDFSNNNNGLKPNLLAKIKIKDYGKNKAIVVPTKVIQESPNGDEFVYTISVEGDGIVQKKMVKTGMAYEGKVEVLEGLVKDEVIITEGGRSLKDGDIVNVSSK